MSERPRVRDEEEAIGLPIGPAVAEKEEPEKEDNTATAAAATATTTTTTAAPATAANTQNAENESTAAGSENLVQWDTDDAANPRNWSRGYKIWITFQLGMLALCGSLGSSIVAPAEEIMAREFGVANEVMVLMISLYILGFAFGPLCWAPIAEIWGRRWGILPAVFMLAVFSIGTACSNNTAAILVTRLLGGIFGSAPISNVAAALGDIWHQRVRGVAITFYAVAVVGGPTLGPIIGAALLVNPKLGWRWTEYIEAIWTFMIFVLCVFALPETYHPVLLKRKAQRLRKETGNENLYHPHENIKLDAKSMITKHFSRPLLMLFTEPMVTCLALYASFVYGILYLTLQLFPIVYQQIRGYGTVVGTLPFLALFIGVLCSVGINLANQPYYMRQVDKSKGKPVPEARLPPMAIGGFLFTGGLFWFGWTAEPKFSWAVPTVAAGFFGAGFVAVFQQCINFLVDTYGEYAASATAANTFLRSILAAALPLAAKPLFHNLGVSPAMSLLGGIAALALPAPFIFMRYGVALRRMSRFAPVKD